MSPDHWHNQEFFHDSNSLVRRAFEPIYHQVWTFGGYSSGSCHLGSWRSTLAAEGT